jgi:hypothetical protein
VWLRTGARVPALLLVQVARVAWQQRAAVAGLLRREGERARREGSARRLLRRLGFLAAFCCARAAAAARGQGKKFCV